MTLMPYVDAVLVFDATETAEYEVFSITPALADRLSRDWRHWDGMRAGLMSTGRIPASDVDFDEATGFRLRTLGLERFAET